MQRPLTRNVTGCPGDQPKKGNHFMKRTISLASAAALGLGTGLIALAPGANAADFTYSCEVLGTPADFATTITADVPDEVEAGETVNVGIDAQVTVPEDIAGTAYDLLGARQAGGTVDTTVGFGMGDAGDSLPAVLDIADTPVEPESDLVLSATGSVEYQASGEGDVTIFADDFTANMVFTNEAGDETPLAIECTAPEGDTTVETFTVVGTDDDDDDDVVGTETAVAVDPEVIPWGEAGTIGAAVTAEDDSTPEGEFLLTDHVGDTLTVPAEDGAALIELEAESLPAGVYPFTVDFIPADDETYASSSAEDRVVVYADTETTLELSETEFTVDEVGDIEATATPVTVPEEAGDTTGVEVLFEVEGEVAANGDGEAASPVTITLDQLEPALTQPGEYTITATFVGNEALGESVSNSIDFTVTSGTEGAGYSEGGDALPATGADAGWAWGVLAATLIGAGASAVYFGRRQATLTLTD